MDGWHQALSNTVLSTACLCYRQSHNFFSYQPSLLFTWKAAHAVTDSEQPHQPLRFSRQESQAKYTLLFSVGSREGALPHYTVAGSPTLGQACLAPRATGQPPATGEELHSPAEYPIRRQCKPLSTHWYIYSQHLPKQLHAQTITIKETSF